VRVDGFTVVEVLGITVDEALTRLGEHAPIARAAADH
jgi:hypothetical protein